uniref:C-type lectin domain-containing protein n=1 Tax=Seriola dumerili TaxID=41447 RepID=A0A3B4V0R4_SERDU
FSYFLRLSITFKSFASDSHCDPGYLLYGDFCYHFETESVKNWQDAEAHCNSEQGHLASFHSQEELSFLTGDSKWIGLKHNPTEGGYSWSDGTPLSHTNWGPGEPNNHEGREECVEMMYGDGRWNDNNCLQKRGFACRHRQCKEKFYILMKYKRWWVHFCSFPSDFQSSEEIIKCSRKDFNWDMPRN